MKVKLRLMMYFKETNGRCELPIPDDKQTYFMDQFYPQCNTVDKEGEKPSSFEDDKVRIWIIAFPEYESEEEYQRETAAAKQRIAEGKSQVSQHINKQNHE